MGVVRQLRSVFGRRCGERGPGASTIRPARIGEPSVPIEGVDPAGRPVSIAVGDGRVVLVFLTSSCAPCQPLWTGSPSHGAVLVTPSPTTESRRRVEQLARPGQVVVMSSEAWQAYDIHRAPWLVVSDNGTVVSDAPAPSDWGSIEA
jgi:hypothetical protein